MKRKAGCRSEWMGFSLLQGSDFSFLRELMVIFLSIYSYSIYCLLYDYNFYFIIVDLLSSFTRIHICLLFKISRGIH